MLAAGCLGTSAHSGAPVTHPGFRLSFSPAANLMTGAPVGPAAAGRTVRCPSALCRTIAVYLRLRPHGSRDCTGITMSPALITITGRGVDVIVRPQCMAAGSPAVTAMVRAIYAAAAGRPQVTVANTSSG